mgnify:FL=1
MMKKKVMPLSCLMAAAMLAGCGTAAPAVPEETTAPEAAQETAPADAAESEAAAVEDTDGNWGYCDINGEEVIPCTYQAAMQAEGASEPIDYPFPDMSGVVVVQDADGARMALYTDGTVCIEAGRFEDLAPAQGGCVWARQNGQWGLLEVK